MSRTLMLSALIFVLTNIMPSSYAQDNPVAYMTRLNDLEEQLSKDYLSYMSEVAHGRKARKMERRRNELIASIKSAIGEANKIRPYKGDASLRDAFKEYWKILLLIFTEDYKKIVNMEEIAERSYDAMEAYILIQEETNAKLKEAHKQVPAAYRAFAEKNNVTLTEGNESKLNKKLADLSKANRYLDRVFLIYFKSTVQETLMLESLAAGDVSGAEQLNSSMLKYSDEGLQKLDTLKAYKNDGSLMNACRKVLEFQKKETDQISTFTDFLIKKEDFEKLKKSFDAKPANTRTQADIDAYNKAVNEQNKAVAAYNKASTTLNNQRNGVMTNWQNASKRFMDLHFPH